MIFRRDPGSSVRNAYLGRVWLRNILAAAFTAHSWLGRISTFPHVRLCMQPYRASRGRKLGGVLQKIRNHALHFGGIEWKGLQLVVSEKIERESFFLKTRRPETADLGETR